MTDGETHAGFRIPRTHEFYRPFIEMILCLIDGCRFSEGGVSIDLIDGRRIDLIPEDGRIAIAITRDDSTRALPDALDADDVTGFFTVVHDNR